MTEPTNWLPPTAYPPTAPLEPEPAPKPREVPLWAPFAALLAVFFVISLFAATAGGILAAGDAGFDAKHPPMGLLLGLMAVQNALFILVAWLTVRLSLGRTPPERLGLRRVADVRAAALWAAAVFVGFWLVTAVLSTIQKASDQGLVQDVKAENSAVVLVVFFVLLCLAAPFAEELLFRGLFYTVLWRRLGPIWAALIVGAVFGLGHAGDAPWISVIALTAFGIGLCFLYWRTGSIVPGMALHAFNNSITFGAIKDLEPAAFAGVVLLSVGVVTAAGTALSARARVAA